MCQPSRCSPKGIDKRRCASKDAGPQRRVDLEGIPHRLEKEMSADLEGVPHRLEKEMSASEDAGPRRGWIVMFPHWLGRRTKHLLQGCGNLPLADAF